MKKRIILCAFICFLLLELANCKSDMENGPNERIEKLEKENQLIVQLAELEIDPTQLTEYLILLQEGIRTAVEKEPGVLSLYAMADEDQPNRITVVEIYENQEAYESHIKSPHFLKYKNGTMEMVEALKIIRTKPVIFAAKQQ